VVIKDVFGHWSLEGALHQKFFPSARERGSRERQLLLEEANILWSWRNMESS
jgi:hypothetical protein